MAFLEGKRVLITGGTGSLGQVLTRRLLFRAEGRPARITILSRDEAKQHAMRVSYVRELAARSGESEAALQARLAFQLGDVRDYRRVSLALREVDVVFNAAALKQVPTCEYAPWEAVQTNIQGVVNLVQAIREHRLPVEAVVGISTDKACKPVNVMGMTKAIQERVLIEANLGAPTTRFVCVRYGNVLASRGSVIPLFREQIRAGGPLTLTTEAMTRFLLSLNQAVDTVFAALAEARPGETYIPRVPSARVVDIAAALIGNRSIATQIIGIRPGEKTHEILISEEEVYRTTARGDYYVIEPALAELRDAQDFTPALTKEYSSADNLMDVAAVSQLLTSHGLLDMTTEPGLELLA